jgi:hypothetical protein
MSISDFVQNKSAVWRAAGIFIPKMAGDVGFGFYLSGFALA